MDKLLVKENIKIEDIIYEIRGKQVMLDSDIAKLYQCKNGTKEVNQAVKNNIKKFPERFSWKLTDQDSRDFLVKNFDQIKIDTRGGRYKNPRVFTEQGVAMLATILKTVVATETSIQIMDAFVNMRKYISNNLIEQKYINNQVIKNTEDIKLLQESFDKLQEKEKVNSIFFEGQIYDAYSLMLDIFNKSKDNIIIIDNYIDKNLLDILSKINKEITIITNKYNNVDYIKYKKQYTNINLIINNTFHDRFIIIDNKELYHCGSSFKDLGKKCFAITKVEDNDYLDELLEKI